jgi:hypothetical protein
VKGDFGIAVWSAIALFVSVLHDAERGKIHIYDDVEYLITFSQNQIPTGCKSFRGAVKGCCSVQQIYHTTIDKKRRDLTVREEEQVKICQSLHLYPPQ